MSSSQVPADLISTLERAVLSSAFHIARFFSEGRPIEMAYKQDDTMVMNLDLQSQEIILGEMGTALTIVAEEDPASHDLVNHAADYFLVDPLDGTASAKRFQGIQGGQVGFGPLAGLVLGGKLVAASFVSLPLSTLFSAVRGRGTRRQRLNLVAGEKPLAFESRELLKPTLPQELRQCGVLFFPGARGEVPMVEKLRTGNVVENMYRFGGFASDCARLAAGLEQVQIQFSVKAWDFPATLLMREAGLQVVCDPCGTPAFFDDWKISLENPLITCPPLLVEELLPIIGCPTPALCS